MSEPFTMDEWGRLLGVFLVMEKGKSHQELLADIDELFDKNKTGVK